MTTFNWRVPIGFLLAPVVPCAFVALVSAVIAGLWNGAMFMATAMITVSLALSLVVCLPTYMLLKRFWQVRLVECVVAGAGTALALNIALYLVTAISFPNTGYSAGDSGGDTYIDGKLTPHGRVVALQGIGAGMALGGSIGFCFWAIAVWRNPRYQSTRLDRTSQGVKS